MPRLAHISFSITAVVSAATAAGVDFDRDVRPILSEHCASCHGGVKKKSGLSVLARDYLTTPNDSGNPAIVPGDATSSELVARITHSDPDERMPPEQPLDAGDIATLTTWIETGAPWPTHWAHTPVDTTTAGSIDQPIDQKLAANHITPSPPAEPHVLLRRLSLDITGLLPTPDQLAEFTAAPDVANAADRLLASPHFGERWARHWLDEARYADSEGYEKDSVKADAYRFRDWVIKAINDDVPFDRFTASQIAGDLLPDRTNPDLVATKFHLQTQYNLEGGVDAEEDRTKRVIDQINTVGTTWLGTTVGCAQCHDHPYDEFTQRDFFSLYAFFNNTDYAADFLTDPPADADSKRSDRANRWSKVAANLEKQVTDKNLSNAVQGALSGMRGFDNSNHFTRYLEERTVNRRTTHIFQRGDFLQPDLASHVQPAAPTALPAMTARGDTPDRLDLSNWITSPENPLTARVTVNKIWARLFGRPLADQPHDFGARGTPPSHPGLLDHLAHYFVHDALWSRKKLIRYIVTSQAYQRSSHHRPDLADIDPDNALLARQNPFRAEAEVIRDIALQSAGLLHHGIGGPSVYPPLPAIIAAQTYAGSFKYKPSTGPDRYRRGLYTFFRRTAIDPNLSTFDCPDSSSSQPLRDTSNNPLQALATLQNEVFHEAAQSFAKSLLAKHPNSPRRLLRTAYLTALSRPPWKQESKTLLALYKKSHAHYTAHPEAAAQLVGPHASPLAAPETNAAWIATLRVVLNLDEFLTRS